MSPPSARALLAAATREQLLEDAKALDLYAGEYLSAKRDYLTPEQDTFKRAAALIRAVVALGDKGGQTALEETKMLDAETWDVYGDGTLDCGFSHVRGTPWAALSGLLPEPEEQAK